MTGAAQRYEAVRRRRGLLLQSLLYGVLFSGSLSVMSFMELKALGWNGTDFHVGWISRKADSIAQNSV